MGRNKKTRKDSVAGRVRRRLGRVYPALFFGFVLVAASIFSIPASAAPDVAMVGPDSGPVAGGAAVSFTGTGATPQQVAVGSTFSCALAGGNVYCWGYGLLGQLGNGESVTSLVPVKVGGLLTGKTVTAITAGYNHACAVAEGKAYCWGFGAYGALGDGETNFTNTPVAVYTGGVLSGKTVVDISGGLFFTCVTTSDGQGGCWGYNSVGMLGDGSTTNSNIPVALDTTGGIGSAFITQISAGFQNACALADGQAWCWGGGRGNPRTADAAQNKIPYLADYSDVLAGKAITSVATSNAHACVIADGQMYCWGEPSLLGHTAPTGATVTLPTLVDEANLPPGTTLTTNASMQTNNCALSTAHELFCYTGEPDAFTGNSTQPTSQILQPVDGLIGKTVTNVSAGYYDTCAIASGDIYCWGQNLYGAIGNNTSSPSIVPVKTNAGDLLPAVTFGGIPATSVYIQNGKLVAVAPPHAAGPVDVAVTYSGQAPIIFQGGFTYKDSETPPLNPENPPETPGGNPDVPGVPDTGFATK